MLHQITQKIVHLFEIHGNSMYGGEAVTQLEHGLQCATLARDNGASDELITASLLHDVGHLLHDLPDDASDNGIDDLHELRGERFLAEHFKKSVVEPVKLHVQAKRYLCAKEPGYYETLSTPSKTSLGFQGGKMDPKEVEEFEKNEYYRDAIELRKWDDMAKDANLVTPLLNSFISSIEASLV